MDSIVTSECNLIKVDTVDSIVTSENNLIRVTAVPHPFRNERQLLQFAPGQTVADLLQTIQPDPWLRNQAIISMDGNELLPSVWESIVPPPGSLVVIRVIPAGRGGGKRGIFGIFIAIAAIAAAIFLPYVIGPLLGGLSASGAAIVGGIASLTVGVIGNLLLNALIPPTLPKKQSSDLSQDSATQYITDSRNQINLWGAVPQLLGRLRIMPLKCALDYSEAQGKDQYVRCMFCLSYAQVQISDLKIGETIIGTFQGVEIEYQNLTYINPDNVSTVYGSTPPMTLYTTDVYEDGMSILLEYNVFSTRTTQLGVREISVDVTFPSGLAGYDEEGRKWNQITDVKVEYREMGGGWLSAYTFNISSNSTTTVRYGHRWEVNPTGDPNKQYEVRLKKLTNPANYTMLQPCYWTALRSFKYNAPVNFPSPLSLIACRIKASDQLNGSLDEFNMMATTICKDWDQTTGTWIVRPTNNPASLFRYVLQGAANPKPIADSRIDLVRLQYWHQYCSTEGWAYNNTEDSQEGLFNVLTNIAAAGRAAIREYDSKWSVVLDEAQSAPAQIFTPRNSWGLEVQLTYPDMPHGFRVSFRNEQKDYKPDERIVLDDGYQIEGRDAWGNSHPEYPQASVFEQMTLQGITNPDNIFKLARYHLAAARLRPRLVSFETDFESLAVTRGDLIYLSNDVMLAGIGSGRIKSVTMSGANMTGVTLDEEFDVDAGQNYALRFRIPSTTNITILTPVSNPGTGNFSSFTFITQITSGQPMPAIGDLAVFGILGSESIPLIVKEIQTGSDLKAKLTCVDEAPAIHLADVGTIPPYNSGITIPTAWKKPPVVAYIQSDWSVRVLDGNSWRYNIHVTLDQISEKMYKANVGIEAQYWDKDSPDNIIQISSLGVFSIDLNPVEQGRTYEFKLRYVDTNGNRTSWSEVIAHKVVGLSTIPSVTNVTTFYRDGRIIIKWDSIGPVGVYPDILYEVRKGAAWDTAPVLGQVKDPEFISQGDGTYWIAARIGGVYSNTPSSVVITGSDLSSNILVTVDEYALGWTGTLVNVIDNNENYLELTGRGLFDSFVNLDTIIDIDLEGGLVSSGTYETAVANIVDLGVAQSCNLYSSYVSYASPLYDTIDGWPSFDVIPNIDGNYAGFITVKVQVAIAQDTTFDSWKDFFPGMYFGRKFKFRLTLATSNTNITPLVTAFTWTVDMPERIESGAIGIAVGGQTVSYSRAFQNTPDPQITIYNATLGDEIFITSKTKTGFTVQIRNGANGVARTIHWMAIGY